MARCASLHGAPMLDWVAAMDQVSFLLQAVAVGLPIDHWDAGATRAMLTSRSSSIRPHRLARPTIKASVCTPTPAFTFILQDEVGGLQVRVGDELVDAPPRPGAYLMNLGEMLGAAATSRPRRIVW